MKLWRYMSVKEFNAYCKNLVLNQSKKCRHGKTTSDGYCFLGDKTTFTSYADDPPTEISYTAEECYSFLSGIVSRDLLVCFDTQETNVRQGKGVYADPTSFWWDDYITITEYFCKEYSSETFKLISYQWVRDDKVYYA